MDMVGDFITRLRNGNMRKKLSVKVYRSNHILAILECLYSEGYIRGFKLCERDIEVYLKYKDGWSVIKELNRISKPSRRVYFSKRELKLALRRKEIFVYTSTNGVGMNTRDILQGGEVLFSIK